MKYQVEYISEFNGHQMTTVESQIELLKLLNSIDYCNGEILDIKSYEDIQKA